MTLPVCLCIFIGEDNAAMAVEEVGGRHDVLLKLPQGKSRDVEVLVNECFPIDNSLLLDHWDTFIESTIRLPLGKVKAVVRLKNIKAIWTFRFDNQGFCCSRTVRCGEAIGLADSQTQKQEIFHVEGLSVGLCEME